MLFSVMPFSLKLFSVIIWVSDQNKLFVFYLTVKAYGITFNNNSPQHFWYDSNYTLRDQRRQYLRGQTIHLSFYTKLRTILQSSEQDIIFKECGNKLTSLNGRDLMVNRRALRGQLMSSTVEPKTGVREPEQREREPRTQEVWDDVWNTHRKAIIKP
jgi:hypothetical protein